MTPLIWGRRIVRYTFELLLSLWNERNNTGHQHSSLKHSTLTRQCLIYQIIAIQESNPDTPYHARLSSTLLLTVTVSVDRKLP